MGILVTVVPTAVGVGTPVPYGQGVAYFQGNVKEGIHEDAYNSSLLLKMAKMPKNIMNAVQRVS